MPISIKKSQFKKVSVKNSASLVNLVNLHQKCLASPKTFKKHNHHNRSNKLSIKFLLHLLLKPTHVLSDYHFLLVTFSLFLHKFDCIFPGNVMLLH